ncbi:hypothetical protein IFR05_003623 [Cadophora sp. M221]|nr:hypothetical protein IFR05_003623 [Cadophora sp. M221]
MQFKLLVVSLAMATQITALPISSQAMTSPATVNRVVDYSAPFYNLKSRFFGIEPRTNTNPEKHEADEQKDKASAEQKEQKEKEAEAKAEAAERKGNSEEAAKQRQKAEEEEGREQTAKKHAEAAERKEQAAKANEAKKGKGNGY